MEISELAGPRFDLACERARLGEPITVQGLTLRRSADGMVDVGVPSSWRATAATVETARRDLEIAYGFVRELLASAPMLSAALGPGPRRWTVFDDYGMGAVDIATEDASGFRWLGAPRESA